MLVKGEELFANAGYGRLESVKLVVAAAHKMVLFPASDSFEETSRVLHYSERVHELLHCADAD